MADSNKSGTETKAGKKSPQGTAPGTTEANIRPKASAANINPNKKYPLQFVAEWLPVVRGNPKTCQR